MLKKLKKKQRLFIEAFSKNAANISRACTAVGITRRTYYNWLENNDEFASIIDDINESQIDQAESLLKVRMNDGDTTALIFFLKTKGKSRGYVERVEQLSISKVQDDIKKMTDEELDNAIIELSKHLPRAK